MLVPVACAVLFFFALVSWLHPRLTTHIDRRLIAPRLSLSPVHSAHVSLINSRRHELTQSVTTSANAQFATLVELVEELIRRTRSGVHARDALFEVFSRHTFLSTYFTSSTTMHSISVAEILRTSAQLCAQEDRHDDAQMCRMLAASCVHGAFIPAALEHVCATLRTHHATRADIRTASAQAAFTVRILTYLPLIAFVILLMSSADMRSRLFHLSTLIVLTLGLFLNRMGAVWISSLIAHTVNRPVDETVVLAEHLSASLRAGCSLTQSLQRWEDISPKGSAVAQAITRGERLEQALNLLPHTTAGYQLAHTILSSHKDGLPVVNTVHRLMSDAHNDMRSATDVLIRQLPGRLAAPLVLCILPSFLFIAVVPLIVHSLGQIGPALSPAITTVS
jgi:Flp pilus assembly protein TadB